MIKASDIISPRLRVQPTDKLPEVSGDTPAIALLHPLLDSSQRQLIVKTGNDIHGIVDANSLLEGLTQTVTPLEECCLIEIECIPHDFSASRLAQAIEDTNSHLDGFWTYPSPCGEMTRIVMRVRRRDPQRVISSLERYGFSIVDVYHDDHSDAETNIMRLFELQTLMNI